MAIDQNDPLESVITDALTDIEAVFEKVIPCNMERPREVHGMNIEPIGNQGATRILSGAR